MLRDGRHRRRFVRAHPAAQFFPEAARGADRDSQKQPFKCLPDFPTGGQMDAREYADGKGSVKVRAKMPRERRVPRS